MEVKLVDASDLHYVPKWKCVNIQDLQEHSEISSNISDAWHVIYNYLLRQFQWLRQHVIQLGP